MLINEAHGLRKDSIRKLLVVLERIPNHVTWVFTTTAQGQQALFEDIDSHPLLSRCLKFELQVEDCAAEIVERAQAIAETEGLGAATPREFQKLAKDCRYNLRDILTHIETGEMMRSVKPAAASVRRPRHGGDSETDGTTGGNPMPRKLTPEELRQMLLQPIDVDVLLDHQFEYYIWFRGHSHRLNTSGTRTSMRRSVGLFLSQRPVKPVTRTRSMCFGNSSCG